MTSPSSVVELGKEKEGEIFTGLCSFEGFYLLQSALKSIWNFLMSFTGELSL